MQHLVDAVRHSVREKNWYAALTGALALPDIAGWLDGRPGGSRARFASWFNDYLLPKYTHAPGGITHVFLSGDDCYALRCTYLHEGDFDILGQPAQNVLERFHFVASASGKMMHCNQINQILQLQVDLFCEEICSAVEDWLRARGSDPAVAGALAALPQIDFI
jgi:hypothetical protein